MSETGDDELQQLDLVCKTNADFVRIWQPIDPTTGEIPAGGVDGWSAYLSIYGSWADIEAAADPLFALGPTNGFIISNSGQAQFKSRIVKESLAELAATITGGSHTGHFAPEKVCVYDLVFKDVDGNTFCNTQGHIRFLLGATRVPS